MRATHGSTVLWGRCFEGEWQPPFGPWVEVLDEIARTADPVLLRRQLGRHRRLPWRSSCPRYAPRCPISPMRHP